MFETKQKNTCVRINDHIIELYYKSVFFFRLPDVVTVWRGVHRRIATTLFKAFANK